MCVLVKGLIIDNEEMLSNWPTTMKPGSSHEAEAGLGGSSICNVYVGELYNKREP